MALLFVEMENQTNVLFQIQDDEIFFFEEIINDFNIKYNDLFDVYSDFRLYDNHIKYLLEVSGKSDNKVVLDFNAFLQEIKLSNKNILILGN